MAMVSGEDIGAESGDTEEKANSRESVVHRPILFKY